MSLKVNKSDKKYMNLAISLAEERVGLTGTNPSVGCVIVKKNEIISVGQTGIGGVPHAEYNAIKNSSQNVKDSTLYVTLEPCSHYGKTPPCTNIIIKSKIKKVIYSLNDIDPRSSNKSKDIFKKNNILCKNILLKRKALDLYKSYIYLKKNNLPFITGKIACTKDYFINTSLKYISNQHSLSFSHILRYKNQGILITYKTANLDNPKLNCRLNGLESFSPSRIIIDKNLKIKKNLYLVKTAKKIKTYIFYNKKNYKFDYLKNKGIKLIYCPIVNNRLDIFYLLKKIRKLKIDYLLVEGGKILTFEFLRHKLFNNFYLIRSDQYSTIKKKNNIHDVLRLIKKNNFNKSNYIKTYVAGDKIIEYIK